MKIAFSKIAILFVTIFFISNCSDITDSFVTPDGQFSHGTFRDLESAKMWAQESMQLLGPETKGANSQRTIDSYHLVTRPTTKSGSDNIDSLFYVFNFADNKGFAIISAIIGSDPILAVTESGHFVPGETTGVGGFDIYYRGLTERMPSRIDHDPYSWYEYIMLGDSLSRDVGVKWGQSSIYGMYCPNGIAGCAPTAIAQIFAYHQHPSSFFTTCAMGNDFSQGDSVSLDWTSIRNHVTNHVSFLPCTPHHNNIGALLREIGAQALTSYNSNGSSTYLSACSNAFDYFDYDYTDAQAPSKMALKVALVNFGPVFMFGGFYDNSNQWNGHFWVADGYKDYRYYRDKYEIAGLGSSPIITEHVLIREAHCLHINWGWNGNCDGYFNFGVYDTDNAEQYDGAHPSYGANFDTNINMMKVRPANNTL